MASKKIKGITIELDGNTTKLDKALKGVEDNNRKVNSNLRDIEKSLKFNPGNTTLVEQQQKNLQKAIEETKEKLNILRTADKQVKEQFKNNKISVEEYEAFQREIIETESKLGNLNKKYQNSVDEHNNLQDAYQRLNKVLSENGKEIDEFADVIGQDLVSQIKKGEGLSKDLEKAIESIGGAAKDTGSDMDKAFAGEMLGGRSSASDDFDSLEDEDFLK